MTIIFIISLIGALLLLGVTVWLIHGVLAELVG